MVLYDHQSNLLYLFLMLQNLENLLRSRNWIQGKLENLCVERVLWWLEVDESEEVHFNLVLLLDRVCVCVCLLTFALISSCCSLLLFVLLWLLLLFVFSSTTFAFAWCSRTLLPMWTQIIDFDLKFFFFFLPFHLFLGIFTLSFYLKKLIYGCCSKMYLYL